jgi:hypothetical protein
MRAYFFGNLYLSSIQQGIQAAHTVVEMYNKYPVDSHQYSILDHWARDHKTMILLNAGYSENIHELVSVFNTTANPLPWAHFNEGKDALDGALTCVGIILPEEFYEAAKEIRNGVPPTDQWAVAPNYFKLQTDWERAMAQRLNIYGMAR